MSQAAVKKDKKHPFESMVLSSGRYSFYLNLPQAASKVGSRERSVFTASGSVLE